MFSGGGSSKSKVEKRVSGEEWVLISLPVCRITLHMFLSFFWCSPMLNRGSFDTGPWEGPQEGGLWCSELQGKRERSEVTGPDVPEQSSAWQPGDKKQYNWDSLQEPRSPGVNHKAGMVHLLQALPTAIWKSYAWTSLSDWVDGTTYFWVSWSYRNFYVGTHTQWENLLLTQVYNMKPSGG